MSKALKPSVSNRNPNSRIFRLARCRNSTTAPMRIGCTEAEPWLVCLRKAMSVGVRMAPWLSGIHSLPVVPMVSRFSPAENHSMASTESDDRVQVTASSSWIRPSQMSALSGFGLSGEKANDAGPKPDVSEPHSVCGCLVLRPQNTRCSKNVARFGQPVVTDHAPSIHLVDAIVSTTLRRMSTLTCVTLVKSTMRPHPQLALADGDSRISRPTSVALKPSPSLIPVVADAVTVTPRPVVAPGVNVVSVVFSSSQGPSWKSTSTTDQDSWPRRCTA